MIGNLEPEEHVMDDSVIYPGGMLGQLAVALESPGWDYGDNVAVKFQAPQSMRLMVLALSGHH